MPTFDWRTQPTIATYAFSAFFGLEIKAVRYDIVDSFVVFVDTTDNTVHTAKCHYSTEGKYFRYAGKRIHLDDCLRTNM